MKYERGSRMEYTNEILKMIEQEEEVKEKELKNLLENLKSAYEGENFITTLADQITQLKQEGYKRKTFTYPAKYEGLIERKLKELGEKETGRKNLSLIIDIAIIEFVLRHTNNPQPKLAKSISGITLPSPLKKIFSQEFQNELRNLPEELAKKKLAKAGKYLTKTALDTTKEDEQAKQEEEKPLRLSKISEEQREYEALVRKRYKKAKKLKNKGEWEKAYEQLQDLDLDKISPAMRNGFVKGLEQEIKRAIEVEDF